SSPAAIFRASSLVMMPCAASIAVCAFEARISCGAKALSKPMEAFISSMTSAGDIANRPPHILLALLSVTRLPSGVHRVGAASQKHASPQADAGLRQDGARHGAGRGRGGRDRGFRQRIRDAGADRKSTR